MKWIKVSERMPKDHVYGDPHLLLWGDAEYMITGFIKNGTWFYSDHTFAKGEITHWQPLPPAPEETE